jgi:hypothetical protein
MSTDKITIQYVPLPPERRAGWEKAMKFLIELMLEELEEIEDEKAKQKTT